MNRRPRLLDLYCCAGGASAGYHAAGFDVTGVDIRPQPYYPFPFILADALTVDLTGYDVVAASPPCQKWCVATPAHRRHDHPDLLGPTRDRLQAALTLPGGPWAYVIENVPGAPMHQPVTICGDTLRLGVRRHRLFESNLPLIGTACWHDRPTRPVPVYGSYGQRTGGRNHTVDGETSPTTDHARAAMGIDWMPWPNLTQAIPPAYTHWLGVQLLTHRPAHELRESVTTDPVRRREPSPNNRDASTAAPGDASTAAPGDGSPSTTRDGYHQAPSVTTADATPPALLRHCHCGQPLTRPATGRWPRHCSHACRQAAYRTRHHTRKGEAA